MHLILLLLSLAVFWLALSGYYTAMLLGLGAASCALVAWLCARMNIVDAESHPLQLARRIPGYWLWLAVETLKSNWAVARCLLAWPPADPVSGDVPTPLTQDLSRATLANSITLTPGTLTLDVFEDHMRVHALRPDLLEDLRAGEMVRRARALEG